MPTTKSATPVVTVERGVTISKPNLKTLTVKIVGTNPYMQARFSAKAMQAMADKMTGVTKKGSKTRDPRDFDEDYKQAMHMSTDGWIGIPASSIRAACISACRLAGFKMTLAKLSIFVIGEGFDKVDGLPLIRIYGEPEQTRMATRNATGVADIRVRPMWRQWHAEVTLNYDADQFHMLDVANLLERAGAQVGIGEGRPDSKSSAGLGFGTFQVETPDSVKDAQ